MADDKRPNPAPAGQAAGGERSGRRYFWRKKRNQKGANETVDAKTQPASSKQGASRPVAQERSERNSPTRRRRRPRSRQAGSPDPKVIAPVTLPDHDYV
ncbi:MAG: hypothetical protein M3Q45_01195, partial [Chloroflexota bacterium]|nr:hypothetical protein [Chloroflexota bacterium]